MTLLYPNCKIITNTKPVCVIFLQSYPNGLISSAKSIELYSIVFFYLKSMFCTSWLHRRYEKMLWEFILADKTFTSSVLQVFYKPHMRQAKFFLLASGQVVYFGYLGLVTFQIRLAGSDWNNLKGHNHLPLTPTPSSTPSKNKMGAYFNEWTCSHCLNNKLHSFREVPWVKKGKCMYGNNLLKM